MGRENEGGCLFGTQVVAAGLMVEKDMISSCLFDWHCLVLPKARRILLLVV
jgi:hypothetical protein